MGATFTGTVPGSNYKDILQVSNSNSGIDGTLRSVSDGEGTDSLLQLSTTLVNIDGNSKLQLSGTTITSTAAELNLLDTTVAGIAVASKALALGANKNVDEFHTAALYLGAAAGTLVTSTAIELNYNDVTTIGTTQASKAVVLSANKGQNILTLANAASAASSIATDHTTITAVDDGSSVHIMATKDDAGVETIVKILDEQSGWLALSQGVSWNQGASSPVLTRLGSLVGYSSSTSPGNAALPVHRNMKRCLLNDNGTVNYYLDPDNSINKQYTSTITTGTTTSTTASKLVDTGANFGAPGTVVGMWVHNTTGNTYSMITAIDSTTTLSLRDDLMVSGETYTIGTSILNGTDGQVMVEIPKFYVKHTLVGAIHSWYISKYHLSGFEIHPAFLKDGFEVDYRYIGAFEGAMYDLSITAQCPDANIEDNRYASGDKMCSVAGYYPKTNETIVEFRAMAKERGSGWLQQDYFLSAAIQLLYIIEYANFNSQTSIGLGRTSFASGAWEAANQGNGKYIGRCGYSLADGNGSNGTNTAASTNISAINVETNFTYHDYMTYRGIENFFGNVWKFVDGFNSYGGKAYVCYKHSNFTSPANAAAESSLLNYTYIGQLHTGSNNYVSNILDYDFGFLATAVGGNASTYLTDYYYQNTLWRIALLGGYASSGSLAGVFCWHLAYSSVDAHVAFSGRLAY